jgi:hypothetical protein
MIQLVKANSGHFSLDEFPIGVNGLEPKDLQTLLDELADDSTILWIQPYNADVSAKNGKEQAPWHLPSNDFFSFKLIQLLMEEHRAYLALHWAREPRQTPVSQLMFANIKANLHSVEKEGRTPVQQSSQLSTVNFPTSNYGGANFVAYNSAFHR